MDTLKNNRMTAGQLRLGLERMPRPCPAAVLFGLEMKMSAEQIVTLTWQAARKLKGVTSYATHILKSQPVHIASSYVFWQDVDGKPYPLFGFDGIVFDAFTLTWGEQRMNNGISGAIVEVDLGKYCDLLEESVMNDSTDLGSVVIHDVTHPLRGRLLLVNAANGRSAVFSQSSAGIVDGGSLPLF